MLYIEQREAQFCTEIHILIPKMLQPIIQLVEILKISSYIGKRIMDTLNYGSCSH